MSHVTVFVFQMDLFLCVRVSLLVAEEKFDDSVRFELHLVHVGVLVLQHLTDIRETADD